MINKYIETLEKPQLTNKVKDVTVGDTVDVHCKIKEGEKERVQVFSGTVICFNGRGLTRTFTVRRIVLNEGVERIFPVNSPNVVKVVKKRVGRNRRAKLFYLRDRVGKSTRLAEETRSSRTKASAAASEGEGLTTATIE